MGDTTRRTVRGDGLDLAVFEDGERSAPTIVLLHGYPDTHRVWNAVTAELAGTFHVVRYDTRGAGESDVPKTTAAYRLDHLEADFAAVLDACAPGQRVHLAGHDWGSIQGWHFVTGERVRNRVATFTSISGPCIDHVAYWMQARRADGPRGWRALGGQFARSWYVAAFQIPGLLPAVWPVIGRRWNRLLQRWEAIDGSDGGTAPTISADGARGVNLYRANIRSRVRHPEARRTDLPVQLIVPTGDRYISTAIYDGVERWAPNLQRRDIDGGHWIIRTQPHEVARRIATFALGATDSRR